MSGHVTQFIRVLGRVQLAYSSSRGMFMYRALLSFAAVFFRAARAPSRDEWFRVEALLSGLAPESGADAAAGLLPATWPRWG